MAVTIESLAIYPIKSCKGIQLQQAEIAATGLKFDRQWMLVGSDGKFMTQREYPTMALIETSLPKECFQVGWEPAADAALILKAPSKEPLAVRLNAMSDAAAKGSSSNANAEGTVGECRVWEWQGPVHDEGADAAAWFSEYLGIPARLVRYTGAQQASGNTDPRRRLTDPEFAADHQVAFADGFPMLLVSEASRQVVEETAGQPIAMTRFRPNIVITGAKAFEEDEWLALRVGSAEDDDSIVMRSVKPCSRCKETTVDQETGARGSQPLLALHKIRSGKILASGQAQFRDRPEWKHSVFFGCNLVTVRGGMLAVGDELHVTELQPNVQPTS